MRNIYDVTFKDKSTKNFSLSTKSIGRREKAEEKIERIPIPMRSGDLWIHTGKYENYERQMIFTSMKEKELSEIYAWLDGLGKLRTDQDVGGFFYASVVGGVGRDPNGVGINDLTIDFLVEPFFYLDEGEKTKTLTSPATITNIGAMESQPFIKVYGSGDVTFSIGSQTVKLKDIKGHIIMDTKKVSCYKDKVNLGKNMIGDYIEIPKGSSYVSWTGNVSKVEIIARWCDK